MAQAKISEEEFIELWHKLQSPAAVAKHIGSSERAVHLRRRSIENRTGHELKTVHNDRNRGVMSFEMKNGTILVGSDAHYWPGPATPAHRGFVKLVKELKPTAVIMNGDAFDGARISRFPPMNWEQTPTVKKELEAVQERLGEIEDAAKGARLFWPLGNHDMRFEARLVQSIPEYAEVHGTRLKDHLPRWHGCWRVDVNQDVVIKHRIAGGIHAVYNNTLRSGRSTVTGHLHSLKVTPWTDYNGTRYGVDTGTMADPTGPQFDYTEAGPVNWRSGFAVLTFHNGRLLIPELAQVVDDDHIEFRGKVIKI
jgi:hypothetical protein